MSATEDLVDGWRCPPICVYACAISTFPAMDTYVLPLANMQRVHARLGYTASVLLMAGVTNSGGRGRIIVVKAADTKDE